MGLRGDLEQEAREVVAQLAPGLLGWWAITVGVRVGEREAIDHELRITRAAITLRREVLFAVGDLERLRLHVEHGEELLAAIVDLVRGRVAPV